MAYAPSYSGKNYYYSNDYHCPVSYPKSCDKASEETIKFKKHLDKLPLASYTISSYNRNIGTPYIADLMTALLLVPLVTSSNEKTSSHPF